MKSKSGDLGADVVKATQILDTICVEIEMLQTTVHRELERADSSLQFRGDEEKGDEDDFYVGDGWLCAGWRWTYPVHKKSRGSPRLGTTSLAVDIGAPGKLARAAGVPILLVAWASAGYDWDELDKPYWPLEAGEYEVVADRLVWWVSDEGGERESSPSQAAWFFAVPLFAISGIADVRRLIVKPLVSLLGNSEPKIALAGATEALKFAWRGDELAVQKAVAD